MGLIPLGLTKTKVECYDATEESDQAKEGPTNFALMAYTSSSSSSSDTEGNPKQDLKDKGKLMEDLLHLEVVQGGKITGKGKISTDTECVVLSPDFKLLDESHVLPKVPRKDNMYSVDLRNVVPQGGIENQINHRVKIIRCDNGTEFKNKEMNQFCEMKGIKREFSVARTPQQNGVAERKNETLIEAARTMLADSKLPTTFWAEAVIPLYLLGVPVTILNTLDHLGKLDGKVDEGFFVGYSVNSKAFRVFNSRTRIVKETLHITFLENKPNVARSGPEWLFDIDALTKSMNYKPVVTGNQSNANAGTKACDDACKARVETIHGKDYILLLLWPQDLQFSSSLKDSPDAGFKPSGEVEKKDAEDSENKDSEVPKDNVVDENIVYGCVDDPNMPNLEEIVYSDDDEDNDAKAYMNNLNIFMPVSPILTTRLHKDHPLEDIIRDIHSSPQTRRMTKSVTEHVEPKKRHWDKLEFYRTRKVREVLLLETKQGWLHRVTLSEEGIEYDAVFDLVARIEAIRMFLAYASFINFVVYHMDVKSAFLYGKIEEEIYIYQPPGFEDPKFPDRVYKIENALYGLHQAPKVGNLQLEIIHKGWLKWNATTVEDGIEVKTVKSAPENADFDEIVDFINANPIRYALIIRLEAIYGVSLIILCKSSVRRDLHFNDEDGIACLTSTEIFENLQLMSYMKARLSKTQGASTPVEVKRMQRVPYTLTVGSIMYAIRCTRPNVAFAQNITSQFQQNPGELHWTVVKNILKYLRDTKYMFLVYGGDIKWDLRVT
ncbi:ribonuclease H-like domain-containing protein [Tanacetum coccineum]